MSDATEKNPQWPGIDPGTLRLVAQCLIHYAIPGPGLPPVLTLKTPNIFSPNYIYVSDISHNKEWQLPEQY
jgi:hypothetical protein